MGYDIHFKLFKNGKLQFNACFNELKNVNQTRYSAHLDEEIVPCKCDLPTPSGTNDSFGEWYDLNSFANASEIYERKYREMLQEAAVKKAIKNSVEYYKLDAEQKQQLEDDIAYLEDDANDFAYKISTCQKMIGFISLYNDYLYTEGVDPEDESEVSFDYEESGDVKVYIFAV